MDDGFSESGSGFDSPVEEHDFGDLQGLLFMFSVSCSSFALFFSLVFLVAYVAILICTNLMQI